MTSSLRCLVVLALASVTAAQAQTRPLEDLSLEDQVDPYSRRDLRASWRVGAGPTLTGGIQNTAYVEASWRPW